MIEISWEAPAQTHRNAVGVASGHYGIALTEKGREHARTVRHQHYLDKHFGVVFTSDTQRTYDTAGGRR